jgi:signal transduction histidine kinase
VVVHLVRSSIVLRTTLLVLGVALGVGLIASEFVGRFASRFESARAQQRMLSLLAVVEPSAAAACFVGDHRLAEETVKGLMNSPSIGAVELRTTDGILAEARRPGITAFESVLVHSVTSPFAKDQILGEIRVYPDANESARSLARFVWALRGLVLLLAMIVGGVLALTVMRTVVQPVKLVSDQLRGLDAEHGLRLESPQGHEADEIGRLVWDVNEALGAVEARQRLEQQVKEAHAQKISSLGSLAGGVAHDFNNMLAGIMGYTDLLLVGEHDPLRQRYLRSILRASTRSSELVGKLLAFGRRGKNRTESVDLNSAVKECLSMVQPSMHPDLKVIPSLEAGLCVDGDPSQLQQVLVNLCINAVEAMPSSGTLTISTRMVQVEEAKTAALGLHPGSYAELKVSDTGPGIGEDLLHQIFEPFFTTKNREGETGTGLGLSMVYGIVAAHQGLVDVSSKVGEGSTFRVLLPLGRLSEERPQPDLLPDRGEGLVLVVEDEPILRDLAREALQSLGYTVKTAQNGQEGVAAYEALHNQLEAVLLDLRMPVMGGREAFNWMQRIDASVPIIICTGYGENEEVQEILSLGGAGMLAKPYRILELSEALLRLRLKA